MKKIAIIARNGDELSQFAMDSARELLYGHKRISKKQRKIDLINCVVGVDGVAFKNCSLEMIERNFVGNRRNPSSVLYNDVPEGESGAIIQTSINNDDVIFFCSSDYDNNTTLICDEGQFGYMDYLAITLSK